MKSDIYWIRRAWERMLDIELMGNGYVERIMRLYLRAAAQIEADMLYLFRRYREKGALTEDEAVALLREPVDRAGWELLRQQIDSVIDFEQRRRLIAEMTAASVKARLDRQQAILLDLRARCAQLAQQEIPLHTEAYQQTADEAYLRTVFDTMQEAADISGPAPQPAPMPAIPTPPVQPVPMPTTPTPPVPPVTMPEAAPPHTTTPLAPVGLPPRDAVDDLLAQRWSGKNFSERVWGNTEVMADHLAEIMRTNMTTGRSWRRCLDEMQAFAATPGHGALYAAERLLRTEQNFVANQMALRAMREMGVQHYRYIATLDHRTSEICQLHDGRIDPDTGKPYELAKAKPGVNVPPLHPNCRSTITAVVDGDVVEGLHRVARDPATGKTVMVPANMTYQEWLESFDNDQMKEYALRRKMTINRSKDSRLHVKYRDLLGPVVPESLEEFQKLKYTDADRWADLQYYAEHKGDRPLYCVQIDRELAKLGITGKGQAYPPDQIDIITWSPHALEKMRGSGVTAADVVAAKASAKVRFRRFPEPETVSTYYNRKGLVGVRERDGECTTVIWSDRIKPGSITEKMMEVIDRYATQ
jgi:SPP1 gp7 family putative phage head morphogenesis protein